MMTVVMVGSYRAWSAERDRADGNKPGAGGKPQQYGRDAGSHNARDGYMGQPPPPRQWENRGGYRPFVPGGMGYVSSSYLCRSFFLLIFHQSSVICRVWIITYATGRGRYCFDCRLCLFFSICLYVCQQSN